MFQPWTWLSWPNTLLCDLGNWLPQLLYLEHGDLLCRQWLKSLTRRLSCCVTSGKNVVSLSLSVFIYKVEFCCHKLSQLSVGTVQGLASSKCSIKDALGDPLRLQWVALPGSWPTGPGRFGPRASVPAAPSQAGET